MFKRIIYIPVALVAMFLIFPIVAIFLSLAYIITGNSTMLNNVLIDIF